MIMGCAIKKLRVGSLDVDHYELELANFLQHRATLDDLWKVFDNDHDNVLNLRELHNLVFKSMLYFCRVRNPNEIPKHPEMASFIDHAVYKLQVFIGSVNKNCITRTEFEQFGTYITNEYRRLLREIKMNGHAWT